MTFSDMPARKITFMVKKISQEPSTAEPTSFEQAMEELAQLVAQMEAGDLPLEASVGAYRRGAALVRFCGSQLERVEQQVRMLEGELLKPLTPAPAGAGSGE